VWKQDKLLYRNLSAPLASKNHIVVGDFEGQVHVLRFEDGAFAARISTDGGAIVAAPRLAGDKVLVQTRKGGLFAISIAAIGTKK
jgi:outer membrane protein assembly factor BamB